MGWRTQKDITVSLRPYLEKKNTGLIHQWATGIDPKARQVLLGNGEAVDYDHLVITKGPKLAFEEIE